MTQIVRRVVAAVLFLLVLNPVLLAADQTDSESEEPVIDVMGKVADHDYFETAFGKIYLPRILFVGTSPYFYSSTKSMLDSGEFVETDDGLLRADGAHVSLDMSITSHLVYVWLGLLFTLFITLWAGRKYRSGTGRETEPRGALFNIFEVVFVFIRDDIAKEFIPHNKYEKYVPYLFTIFMAIGFMNMVGLLPWAAVATADLTVTATLAAITFFITQFSGTKDHWQHVFVFPGVPAWTRVILTPVEIIGLFTKPFALAIRLFANMLSGKIMIISILGLIFIFTDMFGAAIGATSGIVWVALTAAIYFLKALVALIQAYVFTLLSAVFIGMAAEEHDHAHGDELISPPKEDFIEEVHI